MSGNGHRTHAFTNTSEGDMPSSEYHRTQAQIVARLALAEPDRAKAMQLNLLALEHLAKAENPKQAFRHLHGFRRSNGSATRNPVEIPDSRAIAHEVGERLRMSLRVDNEIPASLGLKLDRLRELERPLA
jgi:hypothetical protein